MFGLTGNTGDSSKCTGNQHVPDGACCDGSNKDHPVFGAVKSGMLVPVQTAAEDTPDVFSLRDEKGHTPAHWACLAGNSTILRFIMDSKGPVDEPSQNELAAHPIHWACVNGHIGIVDILLQHGVSIDITDNKGCTPLIVAAQYGHTMMAGYLMGKGARLQMVDKDGDNALHWASFKGHSELMRLLIYSGFNPRQTDNYGQTPLHLACINGNITAVMELCEQDGVEVDIADKNGKTPLALATGRRHQDVCDYIKNVSRRKSSIMPKIDIFTIAFGPPGNSKAAILFFMINILCWGYPMYVFKCLPYTWYDLHILHILFFLGNIVMWICLFHASTTDPGYLPRNIPEYDQAIKQVAQFSEWKQGENPLSRLCHTCRTVKPLRSKHCKICNRCVKVFDHHCPYIYNCVGYYNRPWFFSFVVSVLVLILITDYFCYHLVSEFGWDWVVIIGSVEATIMTVAVTAVALIMFLNVVQNLTTNDRACYKRYPHMKDKDGNLFNPFYGGIIDNTLDFFFIKLLPRDDNGDYLRSFHAAYNVTANERINHKRYNYLKDGKGSFYNPFDRGRITNCKEFFLMIPPLKEGQVEILNI